MKNQGIVKRGCFLVVITWSDFREGRAFKSWRNAYSCFRRKLRLSGVSGASIIYSDGLGNYRLVCIEFDYLSR